jgi:hypothetical protein
MKTISLITATLLLGLALFLVLPNWGSAPEASENGDTVYLCSETQELIRTTLQTTPAVHPQTGRATLLRALYCDQCRRWHAVPPPDAYNGNPLAYPCPKHRSPMTQDGPIE